jgi:hypothetical protein
MPHDCRSTRSSLGFLLAGLGGAALAAWPVGMRGASLTDPMRTEVRRDYPRGCGAFKEWLDRSILPGRTTLAEVIATFGPRFKPLDRPRRDGAFGLQYLTADLGVRCWEDYLVFEFDTGGRVVDHYFLTLGISGSPEAPSATAGK